MKSKTLVVLTLLQPFDWIEVPEANPFGRGRIGPTILGFLTGGM